MWPFKRTITLRLYMKSGNVIEIDRIKDYTIKNEGNAIVGLNLTWKNPRQQLLVKTIDLTQIEAVTVLK